MTSAGIATAQVNVAHWDGGTFIPALAKQTAVMAEAGYNFDAPHLVQSCVSST